MHTITVIFGGLVLLALFAALGRIGGIGTSRAALWFIPVWLACAAINMWIGVNRAGYSYAAEFPIFLLVFALPAIVAVIIRRRSAS